MTAPKVVSADVAGDGSFPPGSSPATLPRDVAITVARLMDKIDTQNPYGHWLWTGSSGTKGYGKVTIGGRTRQTHRVTYELFVGPIADGLELDHLCRTPLCVNPAHLEPVTGVVNRRRAIPWRSVVLGTHCPQGHPYDEANTYLRPDGGRNCRACGREVARRRRRAA